MYLYNANQGEKEGLEVFYLRLAGQTAKGGWAEDAETEVIREIFQANVRFVDIQQELCIRPGANIDSVFAREGLVNDRNSTKAESIIEHFWNPL